MKNCFFILFFLSSYYLTAQPLFTSLDQIPVCENLTFKVSFDRFAVYKPYREEIYAMFNNKDKIGEKYKLWALKFRQIDQYDYNGDITVVSGKCFEFYLKQLNARQSLLTGPDIVGESDEIDISKIKNNEVSEAVFFYSDLGGGSFEWYYLSNNQLHRFSVTIGLGVFILEEIYEYSPDIEIPNVESSGFQKYENAFFDALNSLIYPGLEGFSPEMNNMVFYTQDDIGSVINFFESEIGQKIRKSDVEENCFFSKKREDLESYYWPSISIEKEFYLDKETNREYKTKIIYHYPD